MGILTKKHFLTRDIDNIFDLVLYSSIIVRRANILLMHSIISIAYTTIHSIAYTTIHNSIWTVKLFKIMELRYKNLESQALVIRPLRISFN
jgi:hypothetical protein